MGKHDEEHKHKRTVVTITLFMLNLHLEELIGDPLNAKEKAEAALAVYMDRYLKEHGFGGTCDSILLGMKLEHPQPDALNADEFSGETETKHPSK